MSVKFRVLEGGFGGGGGECRFYFYGRADFSDFFEAYKSPIPKRRNCLQNAHFYPVLNALSTGPGQLFHS